MFPFIDNLIILLVALGASILASILGIIALVQTARSKGTKEALWLVIASFGVALGVVTACVVVLSFLILGFLYWMLSGIS